MKTSKVLHEIFQNTLFYSAISYCYNKRLEYLLEVITPTINGELHGIKTTRELKCECRLFFLG